MPTNALHKLDWISGTRSNTHNIAPLTFIGALGHHPLYNTKYYIYVLKTLDAAQTFGSISVRRLNLRFGSDRNPVANVVRQKPWKPITMKIKYYVFLTSKTFGSRTPSCCFGSVSVWFRFRFKHILDRTAASLAKIHPDTPRGYWIFHPWKRK